MKMHIDVGLSLLGAPSVLYALYSDDVDAEGTMIAKYVQPLVDACRCDTEAEPIEHGRHIILEPWRIVAVTYEVWPAE